ncbi:putative endo-polygalacturonase [Helianthus annuus]|nr:putative endo-polygalacturonase [Helianthus annuus]
MLRFEKCDGLQLSGTRHINSPKSHVSLTGCKGADIGNLHISAPKYSPNTDGIGISWSSHVNIHDSVIQSGMASRKS